MGRIKNFSNLRWFGMPRKLQLDMRLLRRECAKETPLKDVAGLLGCSVVTVKRLYAANFTLAQVADELGVDRGTVRRRLEFMQVPVREGTDVHASRNEEIREAYLAGRSCYKIGFSFGLSGSQVLRVLERLGVPILHPYMASVRTWLQLPAIYCLYSELQKLNRRVKECNIPFIICRGLELSFPVRAVH